MVFAQTLPDTKRQTNKLSNQLVAAAVVIVYMCI